MPVNMRVIWNKAALMAYGFKKQLIRDISIQQLKKTAIVHSSIAVFSMKIIDKSKVMVSSRNLHDFCYTISYAIQPTEFHHLWKSPFDTIHSCLFLFVVCFRFHNHPGQHK